MLILPPGHAQEIARRRQFATREKWMIGGVLSAVLVIAVVVVISIATAGHKSGHGCISVSLAYSTGGTQNYLCGTHAKAMCAGVGHSGLTGKAGQDVARACRKAGLTAG